VVLLEQLRRLLTLRKQVLGGEDRSASGTIRPAGPTFRLLLRHGDAEAFVVVRSDCCSV
jgi:hypothetical protein